MKFLQLTFFLLLSCFQFAQVIESDSSVPYRFIPDAGEEYTAGAISARMIDGLGFRFYWATEALSEKELEFRPGANSRSIEETITHIYDLTNIILQSVDNQTKIIEEDDIFQQRNKTLVNLKKVSDILLTSNNEDFKDYKVVFENGSSFPFWNLINGPIADNIWHCGQIAMLRRLAGNPFNPNVSHFNGTVVEE